MLTPAFQLNLNERILHGQATVGKYDGQHSSLTCGTTAGKVFIHDPHHLMGDQQIRFLNINKQITALAAGEMSPEGGRDVLLVGTNCNLQCYDVDQNKDLFFKDIPDGVNVMTVGKIGDTPRPLALVGGNCSIQGFDAEGVESYWTVTGDNVSAIALEDTDRDGYNELIVGSEDFDIRIFQNEEVVAEVREAEQIVGLCPMAAGKFGYALCNGTMGVYEDYKRAWRVKSKHSVCAIRAFDLNGDGLPELICGLSNGRVEARNAETSEVLSRDTMAAPITAMLQADYRNDGVQQLIVCSADGEVKGYQAMDTETTVSRSFNPEGHRNVIAELSAKKQELMHELSSYQANMAADKSSQGLVNIIPGNTKVDAYVAINRETFTCDLVVVTNNETVIRGVTIFGEHMFQGESLFACPKTPTSKLLIPLHPEKDVSTMLMLKIMVGTRTGNIYHVFDMELELPKFCMYASMDKGMIREPDSMVTFMIAERVARLVAWIESRFNVRPSMVRQDALEAYFICLRDHSYLSIKAQAVGQASQSQLRLQVATDNMETAGEIVQDLCSFLNVQELQSTAEFPKTMSTFREVLQKVEDYNNTRLKLQTDVADTTNLVKLLVVKAEDSRMLRNMGTMRRCYRQLHDLNKDLLAEHMKRATNHAELLESLKEVNNMVQRAARLRLGPPSAKVISSCRAAIKSNNVHALFKIIQDGEAAA